MAVVIPELGGVYYADDGTASVVLEDNYDEKYEPAEKEILEYADWLGMKTYEYDEMMWIAKEGLKAPLPKHWRPCKTDSGDIYYFNFETGDSLWDHPMDEHYKDLFISERQRLKNMITGIRSLTYFSCYWIGTANILFSNEGIVDLSPVSQLLKPSTSSDLIVFSQISVKV
jgi:centrosomal protein CEP164